MREKERYIFGLLILVFLILASIYNAYSLPFEAPDEIGHYYYVRHLLREKGLPVIPDPASFPYYAQEGTQAPLYYLSGALFVRLLERPLGLDIADRPPDFAFNPHTTCGQADARNNVASLAHNPRKEHFPYQGEIRTLHTLRLWSTLLAAGTVAGVYATARLVFPDHGVVAWLAAGFTAFAPEFIFTAAAINNDTMITLWATWGGYLSLRVLKRGMRWWHPLLLGGLAGLATLSKASGLVLLPFSLLAIAIAQFRHHKAKSLSQRAKILALHAMLAISAFSAIAGWWFVRNWHLYGDPTAMQAHLAVMPVREQMNLGIFLQELPGVFLSWWGVFGCTMPPSVFYMFYALISVMGLAGLIADRRRVREKWRSLLVMSIWLGMMFVAYVRWNWVIHAAKGRLLYPTFFVVATLLGRGWGYWHVRWRFLAPTLLSLMALIALFVPFVVMAPPTRLPPIYTDPAEVAPTHRFEGQFGDSIALLGYDLHQCSFAPGETVDLTLYWQARQPVDKHYTLSLQMVSAIPNQTTKLLNYNTWTGGGDYPTGYWQPAEIIVDSYQVPVPDRVSAGTQGWFLYVILHDLENDTALPFKVGDTVVGKAANLTMVRVGSSNESKDISRGRLSSPVFFDHVIRLDGLDVQTTEEAWRVSLTWTCLAPMNPDYTVFLHVNSADGDTVANADAPPLKGGFPTSLWQPGDQIHDVYLIPRPQPRDQAYTLELGWYDPQTGARLAAVEEGADEPLPNAALTFSLSNTDDQP